MKIDLLNDRKSLHGDYKFDAKTGLPLNIVGRTGLSGRGRLGLKTSNIFFGKLNLFMSLKLNGVLILFICQLLQGMNFYY
jgi:hypothetical protein